MPLIEIECPGGVGYGTRILADGHELPEVTKIDLAIGIEDPVTVTVTMLASEPFKFQSDAKLVVNVIAREGWRIVSRPCSEGWEYTAEKLAVTP